MSDATRLARRVAELVRESSTYSAVLGVVAAAHDLAASEIERERAPGINAYGVSCNVAGCDCGTNPMRHAILGHLTFNAIPSGSETVSNEKIIDQLAAISSRAQAADILEAFRTRGWRVVRESE